MPDLSQLTLFITGTIIIVVIPGPNILYLIARSIHQGRMAGLASVLGIEAATIIHICAATLGLTSVLLSSALAFNVVKYLGAAYLVNLGIRKLLMREENSGSEIKPQDELKQVFVQGFLAKSALFNIISNLWSTRAACPETSNSSLEYRSSSGTSLFTRLSCSMGNGVALCMAGKEAEGQPAHLICYN